MGRAAVLVVAVQRLQGGDQHVVLVGEVLLHHSWGHVRLGGDLADGGHLQTTLGRDAPDRLDDLAPTTGQLRRSGLRDWWVLA
jgi:hypothetical protein